MSNPVVHRVTGEVSVQCAARLNFTVRKKKSLQNPDFIWSGFRGIERSTGHGISTIAVNSALLLSPAEH